MQTPVVPSPALRMGTVCSGIGAPEAAAGGGLGIETVWQSEIEPFPAAVLAARYPGVPNLGDMCGICGGRWRDDIEHGFERLENER